MKNVKCNAQKSAINSINSKRLPKRLKLSHAIMCGLIAANLLSGINQSWAACGQSGQCLFTDGEGGWHNFTGGVYETIGNTPAQTAIYVNSSSYLNITDSKLRFNPSTLTEGYAVWIEDKGYLYLTNVNITGWNGIYAKVSNLYFNMYKSTIDITGNNTSGLAVSSIINDYSNNITVESTEITTNGNASHGILADKNSNINIYEVDIAILGNNSYGIHAANKSNIYLYENYNGWRRGKIITEGDNSAAIYLSDESSLRYGYSYSSDYLGLDLKSSGAHSHGIVLSGASRIELYGDSKITASGVGGYGLLFEESANTNISLLGNRAVIKNSELTSQQASAIMAQTSTLNTLTSENSTINGADRLAEVKNFIDGSGVSNKTHLEIQANGSWLFGGARVEDVSYLEMDLRDTANQGTEWTLRHDASGNGLSEVSLLKLRGSTIRFDAPLDGAYQTLRVGVGDTGTNNLIYRAKDTPYLMINTLLNEGGDWSHQFTDRLLIEGDVSGQTIVQINAMPNSPGGQTSPSGIHLAHEGISIVQVAGQAKETSFALDGGYVTLGELPYT